MRRIFILILCFYTSFNFASPFTPQEQSRLKDHFYKNIKDTGAIVASPSKSHPDYFYDWVRDSAIAMGLIEKWYETSHLSEYKKQIKKYIFWVEHIQHQPHPLPEQDILGEPKFYLTGKPYDQPWGRPQNDGPAIRATVLTRFALTLLKEGEDDFVRRHLYHNSLNPQTMGVIKMDLEYTAHHWQDENFDLWEEIYGHHFFTSMMQRSALIEGAMLAKKLSDFEAAEYYLLQAKEIERRLYRHIDHTNNIIQETLPPHTGPQKYLELDSAVILAVLMDKTPSPMFQLDNPYVKNTIKELHQYFKTVYPINNKHNKAILYGRYPGDSYDGYESNRLGNPWYLLTAAMAEYYYTLAEQQRAVQGKKEILQNYVDEGDRFLELIKSYAPDMYISEQINRFTGQPQGAYSLTWSYVSVFRALLAREKATRKFKI